MGVNIDLNFAKDYQGQWTRMFRDWVLQNKSNESIGKHLGGLEGKLGKEDSVAAHEGPWQEGKPSILNPRNQPQHFRSVVLKADEINRTFTDLSVRNPELLKIGPADYEAGKSEGVALVGSLKPWQIRLPVMKFSGRALYEQKFYLQMSGKQINVDKWELCFPVCGKNITGLLGDYSAGSLLRELQTHCEPRPDAKQSKVFAQWDNGKEMTLENWYNAGNRVKDQDVYAANLDAFWETWMKGNKSKGYNSFGYVFSRKRPTSGVPTALSPTQPSVSLVPNHRKEDPRLWTTSRLQVNRMDESKAKVNGSTVPLLEYLESTVADSSIMNPQLSASYSLQRKVDLAQNKGIYAQCDSPSAAVPRAIEILGRELAAKLHIRFGHVDKDGYHNPKSELTLGGTLGCPDENIEDRHLFIRNRCTVTTILQMGVEYDPHDIDKYVVIASYQSTIAYTQIYYLQQDGANTTQYYEDVPVHGRLNIDWSIKGEFNLIADSEGCHDRNSPHLEAEPLSALVKTPFMVDFRGTLIAPFMQPWMLQPMKRSPQVIQELVAELDDVWNNNVSDACFKLINSVEVDPLETLPPLGDFTKSTLVTDPNIQIASDTRNGLLGWFGGISAMKDDTQTLVSNGARHPTVVDIDPKPAPKPTTAPASTTVSGGNKPAIPMTSTINRPLGEHLEDTQQLHWKVLSEPPLIKTGQKASITIQADNPTKSIQSVDYLMVGLSATSGIFTDNKLGFSLKIWTAGASSKPRTEIVTRELKGIKWQFLKVCSFKLGPSEVVKLSIEGIAGAKGVYDLQVVEVTLNATGQSVNKSFQLKIGIVS
ncbi:hypothetical protein GRF29_19g81734 [Pseudopithomyces chartarum]|uniref:Uncharacterized protein n=1 Tax=Pseudopithomyces chartarum TaxID=1892770 RepID=A0AAN6M113_9PLEO|nr:hypothetical protein GRF29_19g81734 [Pseudopithomyces chartarum]